MLPKHEKIIWSWSEIKICEKTKNYHISNEYICTESCAWTSRPIVLIQGCLDRILTFSPSILDTLVCKLRFDKLIMGWHLFILMKFCRKIISSFILFLFIFFLMFTLRCRKIWGQFGELYMYQMGIFVGSTKKCTSLR